MPITTEQTATLVTEKKIIKMEIDVESRRITYTLRYHTTGGGVVLRSVCHSLIVDGENFAELATSLPDGNVSMYENIAGLSYAMIESKGLWPE